MQNHNEMYFIPTRIAIIKKIEVLVRMWRKWNPHKMLVGMYGWPLNKTGVRGTDTSYSQKFTYNLQLALHICVDLDLWIQTTAGCVLLECLLLKKSTYKWTCTGQTLLEGLPRMTDNFFHNVPQVCEAHFHWEPGVWPIGGESIRGLGWHRESHSTQNPWRDHWDGE